MAIDVKVRPQRWPSKPVWMRIVREGTVPTSKPMTSPASVWGALKEHGVHLEEQEVFYVLVLDTQNKVRLAQEVTRGTLNSSLVHPREVFRLAIVHGAAGIIVAHNHPSGNVTPSLDDKAVTLQLTEAGKLLDIPVYDHLIVGDTQYFSFAEAELI